MSTTSTDRIKVQFFMSAAYIRQLDAIALQTDTNRSELLRRLVSDFVRYWDGDWPILPPERRNR